MAIVRVFHNKQNPYVMLSKAALNDEKLSWAAKGLWAYLMARPDNWQVSVSHLKTVYEQKGGGEKAIYALLNELIQQGYCERFQGKNELGQFERYDYVILEFKKCLPHSFEADAPKGPPTKYREKLNKEENKQTGSQTSKVLAKPAVVFSEKKSTQSKPPEIIPKIDKSLESRTDIALSEKLWITQNYDSKTIEKAIAWATNPNTKIKTTLVQAIKWACKNASNLTSGELTTQEQCITIAKQAKSNVGLKNNVVLDILSKGIEFVFTGCQKEPIGLLFGEKGFIDKFNELLNRYKACPV